MQILPSDFVTKSDGFLFMEEVYGRSFNNEYQLYLHRGLSDSKFEAAGGNPTYWQMGIMHRDYLKEYHSTQFNTLVLSGALWTYLADLNEQANQRLEVLITQLKSAEGVTEGLKASDPMSWTRRMNNIAARAEEIIREELIYNG